MKRPHIGSTEVTLTQAGVTNSPAKLVPAGAVLVVVRSGILKHTLPVARASHPVALNQDMKALIPGDGVDSSYLAHMLKALQRRVLSWVRATTADNFPIDKLLDLEVELPPLDEQRRMAEILDQADAVRARRNLVLANLNTLDGAIFESMFDGSGFPRHAIIEHIVHQQIGIDRRASEQSCDRAHDYVKMDVITRDGRLNFARLTRIDASPAEEAKYSLAEGDLILNTRNSRELVGKSAVYRGKPRLYNNNLMRIRFDEQVLPDYAHGYLWSRDGRRQLDARKSGTTNVFAVYAKSLATLEIPVPPLPLQRAFSDLVAQTNRQRALVLRALDVDLGLLSALRVRAFHGTV